MWFLFKVGLDFGFVVFFCWIFDMEVGLGFSYFRVCVGCIGLEGIGIGWNGSWEELIWRSFLDRVGERVLWGLVGLIFVLD